MINNPMRNNPMFPNQPPVAPNPQRAITPNPSGIATLQQYVNPRAPMPNTNTGIPATRKKSSSFDKLPDEVKEIIEKLDIKAKKKKTEPVDRKMGGDSNFGDFTYDAIKNAFERSPKMTAITLLDMGGEGANILNSLIGMLPFKKGGHAKKQRKRKPYKSSGFVRMKKSKKKKYI